jgi:protein phosphatase
MAIKIQKGNHSDVGKVRQANEDYFGAYDGKYGNLIIVSDGMGGYKGGKIASQIAVDSVHQHFESLPEQFDAGEELRNAVRAAHNEILNRSSSDIELRDMGATIVVLLIRGDKAYYAHVGDSRLYLVRKNQILQLTRDHSLVQQLVDANIITAEKAKQHPQKNVISRALGARDQSAEAELPQKPLDLYKDDVFVLCTDGLTNHVESYEIQGMVTDIAPLKAALLLVDRANDRGGKDNITVQVVKVIKGKRPPVILSRKILIGIMSIFLLPVFILLIFVYPGLNGTGNNTDGSAADTSKQPVMNVQEDSSLNKNTTLQHPPNKTDEKPNVINNQNAPAKKGAQTQSTNSPSSNDSPKIQRSRSPQGSTTEPTQQRSSVDTPRTSPSKPPPNQPDTTQRRSPNELYDFILHK